MGIDKHRYHAWKLDALLMKFAHGQGIVTQVKEIRGYIDNYTENSQKPDFIENENIYDDIDFDIDVTRDREDSQKPDIIEENVIYSDYFELETALPDWAVY